MSITFQIKCCKRFKKSKQKNCGNLETKQTTELMEMHWMYTSFNENLTNSIEVGNSGPSTCLGLCGMILIFAFCLSFVSDKSYLSITYP